MTTVPLGSLFTANGGNGAPIVPGGSTPINYGNLSQCAGTNMSCNQSALQTVGFNPTQASVMSCIAMTESSGVPSQSNGDHVGLFEIGSAEWNQYAPAQCQGLQNRTNATCNAQTAYGLYQARGYQPWTGTQNGQAWNPRASQCVSQYGA
jgi:hypothetical protein